MNNTKAMKRIDIVIGEEQFDKLIELLSENKIRGYSVLRKIGGLGSRGFRSPYDVLMQEENVLVVVVCEIDPAENLIKSIQPKLKDFGGMCLVSDCLWVEGPPISY
jgi:PII-like signaling protein